MDADVIVVGAGPAGLMLAGELGLAGVRALVLERQPAIRQTPRAGGLGGQILRLLRYRGVLERFTAASPNPSPAPRFPFGGVHVDLTGLARPPLRAMVLPQPLLEQLLEDRARELGAAIRRGHEVIGVSHDDASVTVDVSGPGRVYQVSGQYLAACDGGHSRVREMAGIPFPGVTYPEVNRVGHVTVPDSVGRLGNGDLDVPGVGRVGPGFTRTGRGVLALGKLSQAGMLVQTIEEEAGEVDDDAPMTLAELQDSIGRVLCGTLPLDGATRLTRFQFQARQAERYRDGRVLLAGDAAHLLPATGASISVGMLDAVNLGWKLAAAIDGWAPGGLLDSYHTERHFAGARAMLQTQAQVALRRGLDPAADALRQVLEELLADEQPARRLGAMIAGSDIRYPLPGDGHHALAGTFAPDLKLGTGPGATSVAEHRPARPVFLDLAGRADLREIAQDWAPRVDIHAATTDDRPADALLIRPDAYVAWAAATGEPSTAAAPALRQALSTWFGAPPKEARP